MINCNEITQESDRLKSLFGKCYNLKAKDLRDIVELVQSVNSCANGSFQLKTINGESLFGTGDIVLGSANVDGSETKVLAGAGITITGSGKTSDPYVFSANSLPVVDGSETKIIAGTNTSVAGSGTDSSPYVINAVIPAQAEQVNSDWSATSGKAQILNKPNIPAAQVNSDWNATSGPAMILNKPATANTNIGYQPNQYGGKITSSNGTSADIPLVSDSFPGLVSKEMLQTNTQESDNINKEISIDLPNVLTNAGFAATINSLPSFTIGAIDLMKFKSIDTSASTPTKYYVEIIGRGKGNYGLTGYQLTPDEIRVTSFPLLLSSISEEPTTQFIDLGINTGNVLTALNSKNPPVAIQSQDKGYSIIKGTFGGYYEEYLWVGNGGIYGQGALQAIITDLKKLSNGADDLATPANSGTVKVDVLVSDPVVYIKQTIDQLLLNKENSLPTGTELQYIRGDKTLATFPAGFTIDQTIIDGSINGVSGNAVYDALEGKTNIGHTHLISEITNLQGNLDIKSENSAGAMSGFELTDNGNGTVNIASGTVLLRATNSETGILQKYAISAVTNLTLTDNANNYVLAGYNAGNPNITVTTDPTTINGKTNTIIYVIARVGNTLHYLNLSGANVDSNGKLRARFLNTEAIKRAQGMAIGFANRNISVTAGLSYSGLIPIQTTAFNTATGSTFTNFYGTTRQAGQTQINNTQYNNAGVLTAMPNNSFRTDYIYVLANNPSKLYVVMGGTSATLTAARAVGNPSVLPVELQYLGVLVGRIIIAKDATAITEVSSAFETVFANNGVTNYNDLANLPTIDQTVVDGSTNAVSGNAVFDGLALKANLASPTFTGVPLAPTATAGTNNTQIATTAFVTNGISTADSGNVKTTGNQSISGMKTFTSLTPIQLINNAVAYADRSSSGEAGWSASGGNSALTNGLFNASLDRGRAFLVQGNPNSSGTAFQSLLSATSTVIPFESWFNGVRTFLLNKEGNATATSFIKSGGTSAQFLKADGSVDSNSYLPSPTGLTTNYLPKWNGSGFVDSRVQEDGVNTIFNGMTRFSSSAVFADNVDLSNGRLYRFQSTATYLSLKDLSGGIDYLKFTDGRVLFNGATDSPIAKNHFNGSVLFNDNLLVYPNRYVSFNSSDYTHSIRYDSSFDGLVYNGFEGHKFVTNSLGAPRIAMTITRLGDILVNTESNNGVDKVQVNGSGNFSGTITASPAVAPNHVVVKSQLAEQLEIGANITLDETHNNKVLVFTANCTVTIPATLSANYSFEGITLAGVTVSWAITSPNTWLFGTPTSVGEKQIFTLAQRGSTDSIMLLGV